MNAQGAGAAPGQDGATAEHNHQGSDDSNEHADGAQVAFNATYAWQDVPDGAILPDGLQVDGQRARLHPEAVVAAITACPQLAELRALRQWVCWRYEKRKKDGKLTKVPYQPNGHKGSSTNSATWSTFEAVAAAYVNGKSFDGTGFALNNELVGTDLDNCLSPTGEITSDFARWVVEKLGSYCEITPSGKGLRVLVRGNLPDGRRKTEDQGGSEIAIYQDGRYLTITANVFNDLPIREVDDATLAEIVARIGEAKPAATKKTKKANGSAPPVGDALLSPEEIAELMGLIKSNRALGDAWSKRHLPPETSHSACELGIARRLKNLGKSASFVAGALLVFNAQHGNTDHDDPRDIQRVVDRVWEEDAASTAALADLGLDIEKIIKRGKELGQFELHLRDGTVVNLGDASNLLKPARVESALLDAIPGFVLRDRPNGKELWKKWSGYVSLISIAAEVIDTGTQIENTIGYVESFSLSAYSIKVEGGTPEWWQLTAMMGEFKRRNVDMYHYGIIKLPDGRIAFRIEDLQAWLNLKHAQTSAKLLGNWLSAAGFAKWRPRAYRNRATEPENDGVGATPDPLELRLWRGTIWRKS